jgi:hypothetical protein
MVLNGSCPKEANSTLSVLEIVPLVPGVDLKSATFQLREKLSSKHYAMMTAVEKHQIFKKWLMGRLQTWHRL